MFHSTLALSVASRRSAVLVAGRLGHPLSELRAEKLKIDCVYSNRVMAAFTVISRKLSHSEILPRSLADGVVLGRS